MSSGRTPAAAVILAFAGALLVYSHGAAPTVLPGDSAELQAVGLLGGIAHPSGYPAFILLGRVFAHLDFADPASRINFMSSFFGAVSVALVALVLWELGLGGHAAFAGAVLYGTTFTFWTSALRAEVYTLSVTLFLVAFLLSLRALRGGRLRDALVAGFCLGLVLTGHLSYLPLVAVLGLALAWRVLTSGRPAVPSLALLLGSFLLGLTPYLYLVWADTQHYAFDYLKLVDQATNPLGLHDPTFDTPWKRVLWLLVGRDALPPRPFVFYPRATAVHLMSLACTVFLFELGPLALPLAIAGWRRRLVAERPIAWLMAAMIALSTLFSAVVGGGHMLPIFIMPGVILIALLVAGGLEPVLERLAIALRLAPWPAGVLCALAALAITLPAHAIRLYANDHPISRWKFQVMEESAHRQGGLLPTMRGFRDPRTYGERAIEVIPDSALVVGEFGELTILRYLRHVEGRRPDLAFQPYSAHMVDALRRWQDTHALARHPFVFLGRIPRLEPWLGPLDSLAAFDEQVYVQRTPLRRTP